MIELIATNPILRFASLATLFLIVVMIATAVIRQGDARIAVRKQLKAISLGQTTSTSSYSLRERNTSAFSQLVERLERAGLNLTDTKSDALRARMVAAGYDSPMAPRLYTLIRLVLIFALPTLLLFVMWMSAHSLSYLKLYCFGSIAALAGMYGPSLFVQAKTDRRREELVNGFPDSLDLMLVCVEAGLGLEAALDRVGREMIASRPLVSRMLTTATLQLRAGASREVALRRMADSVGIDEIRSFAALLIQSDKLGTSIAATLRVYANEMREKRRMRAEEKAHRIPVLISIPLVTCMLPVMIGVIMLPASIQVVRHLLPALHGGH